MIPITDGVTTSITVPADTNLAVQGKGVLVFGPGRFAYQQRLIDGKTNIIHFRDSQVVYLQGTTSLQYEFRGTAGASAYLTTAQVAAGGSSPVALDSLSNLLNVSGYVIPNGTQTLRVAALGDSRVAMWHHTTTPTVIARSGGVTTVTLTAHALKSNALVRIFGVHADTTFNVDQARITRVDANTFTYPQPGLPDATPTLDATFVRVQYLEWSTNISPFQHFNGNPKIRGACKLAYNFGCSSEQTTDMIARLSSVLSYDFDVLYYDGGVNDTAGTAAAAALPAASTIANDVYIVEAALAAGKRVWLGTILPLNSSHSSFGAATPKIEQINAARRELAKKYHGRVILIDGHHALVNPDTGAARAGAIEATSPYVHLVQYGARLWGDEWAASVPFLAPGRVHTGSKAQARAQYATSTNLWPVGQWSQTAGGTQTGASNGTPSGTDVAGVLAGFNVTVTNATAATLIRQILDTNGNVMGYAQVVQVTPTAAGTCTIQAQSTATMLSVNSVATVSGMVIRPSYYRKITGVTSKVQYDRCRINLTLTGAPDSVTLQLGTPWHSDSPAVDGGFGADDERWVVGEEMVVPPFATMTQFNFEHITVYSGVTSQFEVVVGLIGIDQIA